MPANRSRTNRWRDNLEQVCARSGAIELAVDTQVGSASDVDTDGKSLIWRVRVLDVSDESISVEAPRAFGETVRFEIGATIVGAMTIGQNRWMFSTEMTGRDDRFPDAITLRAPDKVERCSRRNFYRVSTAQFNPAPVECWSLIDPTTVISAEVANQAIIQQAAAAQRAPEDLDLDGSFVLPEVGLKFAAKLANIGGGGAGLLIDRDQAGSIDRSKLFWMRIDLTPQIPAPIGLTGRVVHTHLDSSQNLYAGMTFDFTYHPAHKRFVVDQISRYTRLVQSSTDLRQAG